MWVIGSVRTALLFYTHVNPLLPLGSAEHNPAGPCRVLKARQGHSQTTAARATAVLPCPMMHCNDHG